VFFCTPLAVYQELIDKRHKKVIQTNTLGLFFIIFLLFY